MQESDKPGIPKELLREGQGESEGAKIKRKRTVPLIVGTTI